MSLIESNSHEYKFSLVFPTNCLSNRRNEEMGQRAEKIKSEEKGEKKSRREENVDETT